MPMPICCFCAPLAAAPPPPRLMHRVSLHITKHLRDVRATTEGRLHMPAGMLGVIFIIDDIYLLSSRITFMTIMFLPFHFGYEHFRVMCLCWLQYKYARIGFSFAIAEFRIGRVAVIILRFRYSAISRTAFIIRLTRQSRRRGRNLLSINTCHFCHTTFRIMPLLIHAAEPARLS